MGELVDSVAEKLSSYYKNEIVNQEALRLYIHLTEEIAKDSAMGALELLLDHNGILNDVVKTDMSRKLGMLSWKYYGLVEVNNNSTFALTRNITSVLRKFYFDTDRMKAGLYRQERTDFHLLIKKSS